MQISSPHELGGIMKTFTCLILLLSSLSLNAAIIAGNYSKINPAKRTHVIAVGMADKLGELFFLSAETKAKLILNLYPNDQVILLATNNEKELVKSSFLKTIDTTFGALSDTLIGTVIDQVSEIASVDIYAHSNAVEGVILDMMTFMGYTLGEKSELWGKVRSKLRPNSYVMIHGCNVGVKMAPKLSHQLGVAVIGALTSTDFQYVYSNGKWSHDYEIKTLKRSKDRRVRMKPDNYSYRGHWGDWRDGGFPTYKVFCGNLDQATCSLGAIQALFSFPSVIDPKAIITKDDFKKNVFDFLCPFTERNNIFNECTKHLDHSLESSEENSYSPFRGPTLNCSFERCEAHFKCNLLKLTLNPGSCKLINENEKKSDAFVREFKFYMDAYELITNKGKLPLIN